MDAVVPILNLVGVFVLVMLRRTVQNNIIVVMGEFVVNVQCALLLASNYIVLLCDTYITK